MPVHESVAVGAFCYAAGAVFNDFVHRAHQEGRARKPDTKVFNFSHNPLDPAIGDLIFEDASDEQMFYILEFKKDMAGISEECNKRRQLNRPMYTIDTLCEDYPTAGTAHLLAWMVPEKADIAGSPRTVGRLIITPYWESLACVQRSNWDGCKRLSAHSWLGKVSDPLCADKPRGFSLEELARYVQHINEGAEGKAASGASSFAMTFKDYRIFAAEEQRALELLRQRELDLQPKHEAPDRGKDDDRPSPYSSPSFS